MHTLEGYIRSCLSWFMLKINLDSTIHNFALLVRKRHLSIIKLWIPMTGGTIHSFQMFQESLKHQKSQETVFICSAF